nr:hypothetical protein B0A51_12764 [Rachicladosporium sp. CCFEE 5018]
MSVDVEIFQDQDYLPHHEELRAIRTEPRGESKRSAEPQSVSPTSDFVDPGLNILIDPHEHRPGLELETNRYSARGQAASPPVRGESTIDSGDTPPPAHIRTDRRSEMSAQPSSGGAAVDATATGEAHGVEPSHSAGTDRPVLEKRGQSTDLVTRNKVSRIDSAQSDGSRSPSCAKMSSAPPLKLETTQSHDEDDQIGRHDRLHSQSAGAPRDGPPLNETTSPVVNSANTLPSFRQSFGEVARLGEAARLSELAEAAMQKADTNQQPYARHHSQSIGSTTSATPLSPNFAHHQQYPASMQASPQAYYPHPFDARSPTSTIGTRTMGDSPYPHPSPRPYAQTPDYGSFPHRRASNVQDPPPPMPVLPSASSSGESHNGYAGSSTDGYSTANTTPIDQAQLPDGTPRPPGVAPMLPLPQGMAPPPPHMLYGPYTCDEVGCTAAPFQTQYLLTSHKHVHSPSRPHYCPVDGCVRAAGGKGFKRKNEMIRHRLVHESPGYVCPFCTDREHKYPRPDNLQRHVKVHHSDKQSDDLRLREVLEKRADGNGKARRRRTGTAGDG